MIIKFKVENFRSFKEETVFDMRKTQISDIGESLIDTRVNNEKLLSVAAIYGPNGSGKSNFIDALKYMLCNMASYGEVIAEGLLDKREVRSFAFDEDSDDKAISFELDFISNNVEYRYGYSIHDKVITKEYLYKYLNNKYEELYDFDCENDKLELCDEFSEFKVIMSKVKANTCRLKVLCDNYETADLINISQWIRGVQICFMTHEVFRLSADDVTIFKIIASADEDKRKFIEYIKSFDNTVSDIEIEYSDEEVKEVYFVRDVNGKNYKNRFINESKGTKKMTHMAKSIFFSIEEKIPLIIDELDSSVHPLLLRLIVQLYHDKSRNKGGQLISTLHDVSILNNEYLRRDEIWFVEKNKDSESEIYSLYDVKNSSGAKERNDASYFKRYLSGYYGAVPSLKELV